MPDTGLDTEADATIFTYGSKPRETIIVTKSDSVKNDTPDPANPDVPKLPNSELISQLLQEQAGDDVSDTRFIIRHAIIQPGTLALTDAHESKGLTPTDMGTWTAADGDIYRMLLGTRSGRPGVFMLTDHRHRFLRPMSWCCTSRQLIATLVHNGMNILLNTPAGPS
jgi:hypothetical protein